MGIQPRHDLPTYDDLRALPPEARAEILDGEIIMSPSANPRHNLVALLLATDLAAAGLPTGFRAIMDVDVAWPVTGEVTRPDVLVVPRAVAESTQLPITERPVVVVEILSPGSAGRDFVTKRRTAQAAGVPEYWVVNPETHEIVRHTLVEGSYEEHFVEPGQEEKIETLPFPYTLRPDVLGTAPLPQG